MNLKKAGTPVRSAKTSFGWKRLAGGLAAASAAFLLFGTVAALWENPFFFRMTPVGGFEISLLAALSLLLGVYVIIKRAVCSLRTVGIGGVLNFLGIACPVCNKILLLLFGGELLLTYFEPIRVYVAAAGVIVTACAVIREWRLRSEDGVANVTAAV